MKKYDKEARVKEAKAWIKKARKLKAIHKEFDEQVFIDRYVSSKTKKPRNQKNKIIKFLDEPVYGSHRGMPFKTSTWESSGKLIFWISLILGGSLSYLIGFGLGIMLFGGLIGILFIGIGVIKKK